MKVKLTATEFTKRLKAMQSDDELRKIQRYFKSDGNGQSKEDYFIGVRMGSLFGLAKEYVDMPVGEIEKLMESPIHEVRAGAMSIMGQCAKGKKCSAERLKELYELYLRRHDRINNWDLVDLASYYVVGSISKTSRGKSCTSSRGRKIRGKGEPQFSRRLISF
jgi:hypothetical protein